MAVSEAVVCLRPVKKKIGAIIEPDRAIAKISSQSFFLIVTVFFLYDKGTEDKDASKYTKDAYTIGLKFASTGFEAVEIEPTRTAHKIADRYPILIDFISCVNV